MKSDKYEKETLVIYRKDGSILKEIDVTNWSYIRKLEKRNSCMTKLLSADHWDIIQIRKKDDED